MKIRDFSVQGWNFQKMYIHTCLKHRVVINNTSVLCVPLLTRKAFKQIWILDRVNTLYADGHVTVIFVWEMRHTYSDVTTNSTWPKVDIWHRKRASFSGKYDGNMTFCLHGIRPIYMFRGIPVSKTRPPPPPPPKKKNVRLLHMLKKNYGQSVGNNSPPPPPQKKIKIKISVYFTCWKKLRLFNRALKCYQFCF